MIAFVCDWESGEIRPREGEIEAAHWFDVLQIAEASKQNLHQSTIDRRGNRRNASAARMKRGLRTN
jgi:NADH pyrophosphatase NudC (nudix superfamily)